MHFQTHNFKTHCIWAATCSLIPSPIKLTDLTGAVGQDLWSHTNQHHWCQSLTRLLQFPSPSNQPDECVTDLHLYDMNYFYHLWSYDLRQYRNAYIIIIIIIIILKPSEVKIPRFRSSKKLKSKAGVARHLNRPGTHGTYYHHHYYYYYYYYYWRAECIHKRSKKYRTILLPQANHSNVFVVLPIISCLYCTSLVLWLSGLLFS